MSILHPLGDSQTGSGGDRESIDSSRYSHYSSLRYSFTQEDAPNPVLPADLLSDVSGIQNRSHMLSDVSGIQNRSHLQTDELPFESIEAMSPLAPTRG